MTNTIMSDLFFSLHQLIPEMLHFFASRTASVAVPLSYIQGPTSKQLHSQSTVTALNTVLNAPQHYH